MNIKLVAVDMDGTLLTPDKQIAPQTVAALEGAKAKGIEVALCTGRSLAECASLLPQLGAVRYAVTSSGSQVLHCHTGEALYSNAMTAQTAYGLYEILQDDPMIFEVFAGGHIYVQQDRWDNLEYYTEFSHSPPPAGTRTPVANYGHWLKNLETPVDKIHVYYRDNQSRESVWPRVEGYPLAITTSELVDLDISPLGSSKALGLSKLAEILEVTPQEVMAIGDNYNDREMLEFAGTAVVMENGVDEMKAIADIIAPSNVEHGVAHILNGL